jgi:hypothetical protein
VDAVPFECAGLLLSWQCRLRATEHASTVHRSHRCTELLLTLLTYFERLVTLTTRGPEPRTSRSTLHRSADSVAVFLSHKMCYKTYYYVNVPVRLCYRCKCRGNAPNSSCLPGQTQKLFCIAQYVTLNTVTQHRTHSPKIFSGYEASSFSMS